MIPKYIYRLFIKINKNDSKVHVFTDPPEDCYNLHKIYINMVHILHYNK